MEGDTTVILCVREEEVHLVIMIVDIDTVMIPLAAMIASEIILEGMIHLLIVTIHEEMIHHLIEIIQGWDMIEGLLLLPNLETDVEDLQILTIMIHVVTIPPLH